jgi:hypothetical protein
MLTIFTNLYKEIEPYLSGCEKRNLLNSTTEFQDIRKNNIYLRLQKPYSLLFYKDANFRKKVYSVVTHPEKQIFVDISNCSMYYENDTADASILSEVHGLLASHYWNLVEVNCLRNLHYLDLSGCSNVRDVSCLGAIHYLNVSNCKSIKDFTGLTGNHILKVSGCPRIKDVTPFANVFDLDISNCKKIKDISPLKDVTILNISYCYKIKDISFLRRIKVLTMIRSSGIKDISMLATLEYVDVSQDCAPFHPYNLESKLPNLKCFNRRWVELPLTQIRGLDSPSESDEDEEEET